MAEFPVFSLRWTLVDVCYVLTLSTTQEDNQVGQTYSYESQTASRLKARVKCLDVLDM